MLTQLKTYLNEGTTYSAIEICELEGNMMYFFLELSKEKDLFHITNKKELTQLSELRETIKKNTPLFVTINTSKVLTKIIGSTGSDNPAAMVNQAFPNLDINNFYYEVIQPKNHPIVSISKKEYIDELLQELETLQLQVFQFSLGICSAHNLVSYLDNTTLNTANYQLTIDHTLITELKPIACNTQQNYHINGLDIPNFQCINFGHIIGHLRQAANSTNYTILVEQLKLKFWNRRVFNHLTKASLVFFIVLLLTNFFVFDHYHTQVSKLNETVASTSSQKEKVTNLDISVSRKQKRVAALTASANSKSTYYLDALAKSIPESILLNEIKYQPLSKPIREAKPVLLERNQILVAGVSKSVNDFSFWIEKLEKNDWIVSVETLDYDFISTNTSEFLIEITLNE